MRPTLWYWKDGTPAIPKGVRSGSKRWVKAILEVEKKLADPEYKVIARSMFWWGGWISTVWLGLDQSWALSPRSKPIIFETMVFKPKSISDLDCLRHHTLRQAQIEHWRMYLKWSNPLLIWKMRRAIWTK